jgi:hypothetical protein
MAQPRSARRSHGPGATIAVTACALVIGLLAGAFVAEAAPKDKFSWAGLAFVPLWLVLELVLELASGILSFNPKQTRLPVAVALVLGFQVAWLALRI